MPSCSVVMVSYHTGAVLFPAIRSVLAQSHLAELVLVDNGNPRDVVEQLQEMAASDSRLKLLTGGGNVGFGRGNNAGAKLATGTFLLLLNPDSMLPPEALKEMMLAFDEVPGAMLAGANLQNPDGTEQRGGRRQLLTPATAVSEALMLHRISKKFTRVNSRPKMPSHTHEVEAISGACMMLRRADYEKLGGFDPKFFLHVEDMDLCMRVHKAGGKVICVPRVKVTHMLSTSGEVSSRFIEWQKTKGFVRYFHKHFGGAKQLPLTLLADLGILVRFVLRLLAAPLKRMVGKCRGRAQKLASKRLMILACGLSTLPETRELSGQTVIVTGATSPLGLCVVRRLLASGAAVLAISRTDGMHFHHQNLRWLKGDLTHDNLHLENYLADIVVHCAPLWHLPQLVHMFADAEISRVVAFGSTSVFGKAGSNNAHEMDVVAALTEAEEEIAAKCSTRGISWTILRPTLIYGLGLDANVSSVARFIQRFKFFPVLPPAQGRRMPVHADDLSIAVMQALRSPASTNKAYNLSGGELLTYRQMLSRIFATCGVNPRVVNCRFLPFVLDAAGRLFKKKYLNGEIARRMNDDLVFSHDDARRDFGFSPRPFLAGGMKDLEGF